MKKSLIALAAMAAAGVAMARSVGERLNDRVVGYMADSGLMAHLTTRQPAHTGQLPIRLQPYEQAVAEVPIPFDFPAANPAINDVLAICKVPAGVEIIDWTITVGGQVDSNGSPTLAFTLGSLNAALTAIATTYGSGLTAGRGANGDLVRAADSRAWQESNAAERSVGILFSAAAATYVAGKKGLLVLRIRG